MVQWTGPFLSNQCVLSPEPPGRRGLLPRLRLVKACSSNRQCGKLLQLLGTPGKSRGEANTGIEFRAQLTPGKLSGET